MAELFPADLETFSFKHLRAMFEQEGIEENLKNNEVFKLIELLTEEIEETERKKVNLERENVEEINAYLKLLKEVKTLALRAGVLNTINLEASLKVWHSLKKVIQNKAGITDISSLEWTCIALLNFGFSAAIFTALCYMGSLAPITRIVGAVAAFIFGTGVISYVYTTYLKTLSVETKMIRLKGLKEEIVDSLKTIETRYNDIMMNTAVKLLANPKKWLYNTPGFKKDFLEITFHDVELSCTLEEISNTFDELCKASITETKKEK